MNKLSKEFLLINRLVYEMNCSDSIKYFSTLNTLNEFRKVYKDNKSYMKIISLIEKNKSTDKYNSILFDFAEDFYNLYEKHCTNLKYDLEYNIKYTDDLFGTALQNINCQLLCNNDNRFDYIYTKDNTRTHLNIEINFDIEFYHKTIGRHLFYSHYILISPVNNCDYIRDNYTQNFKYSIDFNSEVRDNQFTLNKYKDSTHFLSNLDNEEYTFMQRKRIANIKLDLFNYDSFCKYIDNFIDNIYFPISTPINTTQYIIEEQYRDKIYFDYTSFVILDWKDLQPYQEYPILRNLISLDEASSIKGDISTKIIDSEKKKTYLFTRINNKDTLTLLN